MRYSDGIIIRKCSSADRKSLRKLCCDTAYLGQACEAFFPDRELLADLIMTYHTDYESEHTWVAECDGRVVGYISASFDESKKNKTILFKILPRALVRALLRGRIWSHKTYELIKYNLKSFFCNDAVLKEMDRWQFPVDIHQNINGAFRGKGIGSRLLAALLDEVEENKLPGIRFKALRQEPNFLFFEKKGFKQIDCKRTKVWEEWFKKKPLYYMEYGISFTYQ